MSETDEPAPDPMGVDLDGTQATVTLARAETQVSGLELTLATPHPRAQPNQLPRGTLVGRYVVLERVGEGGMGVVFAAYDPQLDRKVAIKLLSQRGPRRAGARERLRREAQALAKLDHPNVVAVHDVGEHGEGEAAQLFVAMEFVRGQTLREWMRREQEQGPRPWPEVLRVLVEAGRGLAAAHGAGLIHRDFKPDNVMIGDDGRVRVMDFGLVREDEDEEMSSDPLSFQDMRERVAQLPGDQLTQTGALLGTPAYMAPEQLAVGRVGPRADQFSFCVTLYEGLYGERPFLGDTLMELVESMELGRLGEGSRGSRVPMWLRREVLQGIARDPRDRHASMQALLDALDRDPGDRRRRVIVGLGLAAALGVGAWGLQAGLDSRAQVCAESNMEAELEAVWDANTRTRAEQAFEATGLGYASRSWVVSAASVTVYAGAWVDARQDSCEANRRGALSDEAYDLRVGCLDEHREHLRAVTELLVNADAALVERAPSLAAALPAFDRCEDLEGLRAGGSLALEPERAAAVRELDGQLARSVALEQGGRGREASELVLQVLEEAKALGHEPLLVRAELRAGTIERHEGQLARAAELLEHAYARALALRMHDEAADAAISLVHVNSYERSTWAAAHHWARDAESLVEASGTPRRSAELRESLGELAGAEGDLQLARVHFAEALARHEQLEGAESLAAARTLVSLSKITLELGELARARDYAERALAMREALLGPDHPLVADSLAQLGDLVDEFGAYEEARGFYQRAFDTIARSYGADHLYAATALHGLAGTNHSLGDLEAAQAAYEAELAIARREGRDDQILRALNNMGILHHDRGEVAKALELYLQALELRIAMLGPDHLSVGEVHSNVGTAEADLGDNAGALASFTRAQEIYEESVGPDHPLVAMALTNRSTVEFELEQLEASSESIERAAEIYAATGLDLDLATALPELARVELAEGHPELAREQLARSQRLVEDAGDDASTLAYVLMERGSLEREVGDPQLARELLERAVNMYTRVEGTTFEISMCYFNLAQLLWALPEGEGRDRSRARELAVDAQELLAETGEVYADEREAIDAWLAER